MFNNDTRQSEIESTRDEEEEALADGSGGLKKKVAGL